jgi:hypothetical protein
VRPSLASGRCAPYSITDQGRAAVDEWLERPIEHVRELRSHLLMKLALLDRRGADPAVLLARQRSTLEPIVAAVAAERDQHTGFDGVLLAWRHATAGAALHFLDEIGVPPAP